MRSKQVAQARMRIWGFSAFAVLTLGGCGLESCAGFGDFEPTPEPEAEITGVVDELPDGLANRVNGAEVRIQAVSVDGAVLAECFDDAEIVSVTLDPVTLQQQREAFPVWQDADAFELK